MKADPTLVTAALNLMTKAIARALQYDPGTQATLSTLNGKVLQLNCIAPEVTIFAVIDATEVRLLSHYEGEVHCQLTGSGRALISLLWQDHHSLANRGVTVSGEPGLLNKIQRLVTELSIDWQEALTDAVGEIAAWPLIQLIVSQSQFLRQRAERFPAWLHDVLTEEFRLVPSKEELTWFYQEVNDLRADTERLQARVEKLHAAHSIRDGAKH